MSGYYIYIYILNMLFYQFLLFLVHINNTENHKVLIDFVKKFHLAIIYNGSAARLGQSITSL